MPHLSLALLGPLQIALDGAAITTLESDKVRALLVYLAAEADRPHRRSALAGLLWPDRTERAALLNLNQALANLRRSIGDRDAAVPLLLVSRDSIQFNASADYTLDLANFNSLLDACEKHAHRNRYTCAPCAARLAAAVAWYRGEFLTGFTLRDSDLFAEWTVVLRERLHQRTLEALDWLATYYEQREDRAAALEVARRQLELDPWREGAHRHIMRILHADGQRSAAIAQYERCRQVLADELGLEPEAQTEDLYQQILNDKVTSWQDANAAPSPSHVLTQSPSHTIALPTPPTPFLGREPELAQLAEYLSNSACRLVTIVGLGGSGKTRLALETTRVQRTAFANGTCFVPLAAIANTALLLPTIASALGLAPGGDEDLTSQLSAHLRDQELLLVLDNMEQLREGVGALARLLEKTPRLTILATSRERLQLRGEWVLELGGLQLPSNTTPEAIEISSATALFLQAARRARGAFAPNTNEQQAIIRICEALAGHPLGIELAAAWVHVLSCAEIETELKRSLELLSSNDHDLPERQRTLRAVLDASWHFLGNEEHQMLCQITVFRGGFTREAATTIAGATLPRLATLINRSWLHRADNNRYALHEFIRQYAAEQAALTGANHSAGEHHLAFFLALVEEAEPHLKGANEALWMEQLMLEHDNLRAALEHALTHGSVESAARICAVLRWFWYVRGFIEEGRTWLERVLSANSDAKRVSAQLQARLFGAAGIFADEQGDYERAAQCYEEALARYRELHDSKGIQVTMNSRGMLAWAQGNYALAKECYEESLQLARELGNTFGIANGLNSLGSVMQALNDCVQALACYEEALHVARSTAYEPLVTMILDNIGEVGLALNDLPRAHSVYSEALARQQAQHDTRGTSLSLQGLGLAALAEGNTSRAANYLIDGLALAWQISSKRELTTYLDTIAALRVAQGQFTQAARLCAATSAFRARIRTSLTPFEQSRYERILISIHTYLDDASFNSAWAAGGVTPLEDMIREALEVTG